MQAVLLLLGGHDASTNVPSSEYLLQEKLKVILYADDISVANLFESVALLVNISLKCVQGCR